MMSRNQNEQFYEKLDSFERKWQLAKADDSSIQKSPLMKFYNKVNGKLPESGKDSLVRNDDAIDTEVRYFGFFCNVTIFECDAKDALLDYQMRDSIEKSFKAGKTYSELDVVRTHSNATIEGRFVVSFCCMTILNELYRRMREETKSHLKKGTAQGADVVGKGNDIQPAPERFELDSRCVRQADGRKLPNGNNRSPSAWGCPTFITRNLPGR